MDYTMAADLYLGDVSSQIYEFLFKFRPAIFINTHKENWQNDSHYKNWHSGKVIKTPESLKQLIDTRLQWHKDYLPKQKELYNYTFLKTEQGEASQNIINAVKTMVFEKK